MMLLDDGRFDYHKYSLKTDSYSHPLFLYQYLTKKEKTGNLLTHRIHTAIIVDYRIKINKQPSQVPSSMMG